MLLFVLLMHSKYLLEKLSLLLVIVVSFFAN